MKSGSLVKKIPLEDKSALKISGARENNLKDISLEIPHDELTVVTGLSGSGKSSLAFDTVYAEGQRRYIETFSPYTRQFLDKIKRPDADAITNVRPSIAVEQRVRITSSRSTVGSITNLGEYLKIIWANISHPICPTCDCKMRALPPQILAPELSAELKLRREPLAYICAEIELSKDKKIRAAEIDRFVSLGYARAIKLSDTTLFDLYDYEQETRTHGLYLVLTRIKDGSITVKSLSEAIELAFSLSSEKARSCLVVFPRKARTRLRIAPEDEQNSTEKIDSLIIRYYEEPYCPKTGLRLPKAKPGLFNPNHPAGACPECKGFGRILEIDASRCVPNQALSIAQGAIAPWSSPSTAHEFKKLIKFCHLNSIDVNTPWHSLRSENKDLIFNHKSREYRGVLAWFKALERKAYKMHVRIFLAKYRKQALCTSCHGKRLRNEALAFKVGSFSLPDIYEMPIGDLALWFAKLEERVKQEGKLSRELSAPIEAIKVRLDYLVNLGLSYLTLDRQARTLSGGETQRVNLATALGSDLISTHFVLDEPSVGLHARDTERLMRAVRALQARGNSLLVVEHDPDCIYGADRIIELGPKAGKEGGEIIFSGLTKDWRGIKIEPDLNHKQPAFQKKIVVEGASVRNLKSLNLEIPLNCLTVLCGVSGSGKSTLVHEVIKRAWEERDYPATQKSYSGNVFGLDKFAALEIVDQSPLSKSPRGNIATYTGIWDEVRDALSQTDAARLRGLTRSSFSFNVAGGRCAECEGAGYIKEEMQFLSEIYVPCEICLGKRFQANVLEVKWRDKNVDDLLKSTIIEAEELFANSKKVTKICRVLNHLGLGHLTLGHSLSQLSGGEAQRLKLVPYLEDSKHNSLLIFDEPTVGLHHYDVLNLIGLFKGLVKSGNSLIVIEHNLAMIAAADWLIELGPDGGENGGHLVASGTPQDLALRRNLTESGRFLKLYSNTKTRSKTEKTALRFKSVKAPSPANLEIRGAREHNLKNIDLDIPLNKIVALCGVSGSGKSTIAKDIIYAEGQRRYLDCLSPYARQFIKELKRPEVESLTNIKPTICVYQHTFQPSRLSTVGTMSEIYNHLRLLFAKLGVQHCPIHPHLKITSSSAEDIAAEILGGRGTQIRVLAPVIRKKKGSHREIFEQAIKAEISQVRVDGIFLTPGTFTVGKGLEKSKVHSIDFVVGKFKRTNVDLSFITEAIRMALQLGGGALSVLDEAGERVYSSQRACPECGRGFLKLDPEDFSFSSRRGRCQSCEGAGVDEDGKLCVTCSGTRLNSQAMNMRIGDKNIAQLSGLTSDALLEFFSGYKFTDRESLIAKPLIHELTARCGALSRVGLDYLPLSRSCAHLSGGELQRLRLASAIGSPLTGALYIFDEPSAGLHPLDNLKVLDEIKSLKSYGNSVLLIEHEAQSILSAEHIIDIGPGGGRRGGEVQFNAGIEKFKLETKNPNSKSPTARALSPTRYGSVELKGDRKFSEKLLIKDGSANNIHRLNLEIPLGCIVCVAGVSGSGKSSLVRSIIAETINQSLNNKPLKKFSSTFAEISSTIDLYRLIEIDQKPIGSTSRSTPASYLGIWDEVRKLFASTLDARSRGWSNSFFSYNSGKGRCQSCSGLGQIKLEMNFLPDAFTECHECRGERFTSEAMSIKYLGHSVNQLLKLTLEEALPLFVNHRKIHQPLRLACELGLEYLSLGQSSSTLSGGESQRLKLVSELSGNRKGHTLYILDEPTTGLHKNDVSKLLNSLRHLVSGGHSVILIEHDFDILRSADWIVELGPGPDKDGGKVIFSGKKEDLTRATPWGRLLA